MKKIIALFFLLAPLSSVCMEREHPLDELICSVNKDDRAKYPTLSHHTYRTDSVVDAFSQSLEGKIDPGSIGQLFLQQGNFKEEYTRRLSELVEWQEDPLFDTKFLSNFDKTREHLKKKEGFQDVVFETEDGLDITGLRRLREGAKYNVVVSNGFIPGRKEGMSTLWKLLPENCNMLLYDARGHGGSGGNLWKDVLWNKNHCRDEYLDVWAALQHMNIAAPTARNVLYGTCSGAFHNINAILMAKEEGRLEEFRIESAFCDSSWDNFVDAGYGVAGQELTGWKSPIYYGASLLYNTWLKGGYRPVQKARNLPDRMSAFPRSIRTVFIHGDNDHHVPIERASALHEQCPKGTSVMHTSRVERPHALMQVKDKLQYALWLREEFEELDKKSK